MRDGLPRLLEPVHLLAGLEVRRIRRLPLQGRPDREATALDVPPLDGPNRAGHVHDGLSDLGLGQALVVHELQGPTGHAVQRQVAVDGAGHGAAHHREGIVPEVRVVWHQGLGALLCVHGAVRVLSCLSLPGAEQRPLGGSGGAGLCLGLAGLRGLREGRWEVLGGAGGELADEPLRLLLVQVLQLGVQVLRVRAVEHRVLSLQRLRLEPVVRRVQVRGLERLLEVLRSGRVPDLVDDLGCDVVEYLAVRALAIHEAAAVALLGALLLPVLQLG